MKCLNCGKEIEDDAQVCPHCKAEVIKVEIVDKEPIIGESEVIEEKEEPKEEAQKPIEGETIPSEEDAEKLDKTTISLYENYMSIVTVIVLLLTFGAPTITLLFFLAQIDSVIVYVIAGAYILLMVANAYIDNQCNGQSKAVRIRFVVNIIVTVLSCFIYMFFIHMCDGCFNMTCIG